MKTFKKESDFQKYVIDEINKLFDEDVIILKNDANYQQGIPDLTVLHGNKWASLEIKISNKATKQPNQPYWVNRMNEMSYCSIVTPDNVEEVLYDLEQTFKS